MLLRTFKKYFIPHKKNNHKPHLLRTKATVFLLVVILFTEAFFLYSALVYLPSSNLLSLIMPSVLVQEANAERQTYNETPLQTNTLLERAAQLKANDMAQKGYFSHTSPDGSSPWSWIQKAGYEYQRAGENLAVNFVESSDIQKAWMASEGHRENILNGLFTEVGIATAHGMYKGSEATFVVQMFGTPLTTPAAPTVSATKTPIPKSSVAAMATVKPVRAAATVTVTPPISSALSSVATLPVVSAVVSKPRLTTNRILIGIIIAIALALALTLIVWREVKHPRLVANGLAVAVVAIALLLANQYIATMHAGIL